MLEKLYISLAFNNLVIPKQLSSIITDIRNIVTEFGKNLEICKKLAGCQSTYAIEDPVFALPISLAPVTDS